MSPETGYQTFGKRAYWLFLSKWMQTPSGFLILAVVISAMGRSSAVPAQFKQYSSMASLACLGLAVISAAVCLLSARVAFRSQQFSLSSDAFKLRTGIFRKQEIAIPYRQIQNVTIERSLYQQLAGVSRLDIVTAGEDDASTAENEARAVLDGVDKDVALTLQEDLLRRADVQRVVQVAK